MRKFCLLMTVMLAGCATAPVTGPAASPLPSASVAATATASPAPSPAATATAASPTASPTPAASPTCALVPTTGEKVEILHGMVYDAAGQPVLAPVQVHLSVGDDDAARFANYQATVTTEQGQWVVNNVPDGADVTITVSGAGYKTVTRPLGTGWFQETTRAPYPDCSYHDNAHHVFNFGGPATADDPGAPGFALQADPGASAAAG